MTLLPAVEGLRRQTAALRAANAVVVLVGVGSTRKRDHHRRSRVTGRPFARSGWGPRFLPSVRERGRSSGRRPEPGKGRGTTRLAIHAAAAPVGGAR